MKYLYCLFCVGLYLVTSNELLAQAFMGFENLTTTQVCTTATCNYVDPLPANSAHDLPDVGGIPVNSPASSGVLGFRSSFAPTRTGSSSTGLNEGDFFGYAGMSTIANNVGQSPSQGNQAFIMEDTDGEVTITFSEVDLSGVTASTFSMDYIIDGGFEFSDGADDLLRISLNVTGCPAAATVDLLHATGSASGGTTDLNMIMDATWIPIDQDLTDYLFSTCKVQLVIKGDLNSSTEEFAFDNISFSAGIVLPVEMLAFTAEQEKSDVLLNWATTQEISNSGFSVERSMDGQHFTEIGWVNGAGESTSREDYSYKDSDVRPGNGYYYRLRQVDFDGAFAYSELVYVYIDGEGALGRNDHFYPNPAVAGKSQLDLTVSSESDWVMTVFDAAGRSILENQYRLVAGKNTIDLDLTAQSDGAYLVRIVGPDETIVRRVVR